MIIYLKIDSFKEIPRDPLITGLYFGWLAQIYILESSPAFLDFGNIQAWQYFNILASLNFLGNILKRKGGFRFIF